MEIEEGVVDLQTPALSWNPVFTSPLANDLSTGYVHVCMYWCMYVYMYVCMYVCMYVQIV